nr:putative ribonuclease H-like domain-containing protein [Tanacetum cinerariifolium]
MEHFEALLYANNKFEVVVSRNFAKAYLRISPSALATVAIRATRTDEKHVGTSPHESPVEQVATSPTKTKNLTRARQKKTIQSDDVPWQIVRTTEEEIALVKGWVAIYENNKRGNAMKEYSEGGSKRHKSFDSSSFNTESRDASINLNTNVADKDEDEVQKIRRPGGRDKARAAGKNKGSKTSGSPTMNDDALYRLMVTEMTTHEKEQRETFLEIKRREVECHEREVAAKEYRQEQEDIRLAFDHRKLIHYKVVLAERLSGGMWIHIYSLETWNWSFCRDGFSYFSFDHFESVVYWNDVFYWLEGLNKELKTCKLNIKDNDHPIMISLDIHHGLHRGRKFLESFGKRYGVNQKGYRCYSPKTHCLFTSMNCDFLETQYYYSLQHSGQGEVQGDPLSWLSYTSAATIGNEIQNHSTTSAEAPNISATSEHPVPNMISEVSSSQPNNLDNPQPDNLDENNADDIQDSTSEILHEHEEEVPRKHVLPPRSNRGVPPKQYSLEKTTRGAKYPMANIAEGNLFNNAKAFVVSLCSEEILSSFEQALKSKKWKNAMDDEMKALKKNKTWDQCSLPQGKNQ